MQPCAEHCRTYANKAFAHAFCADTEVGSELSDAKMNLMGVYCELAIILRTVVSPFHGGNLVATMVLGQKRTVSREMPEESLHS